MSRRPRAARASAEKRVAIIGAGFSGLGMARKMKERGFTDFTIFEAADEVGGTWRDNTYPGCACDVPSALYSLSFDLNDRWSYKYSRQPEIFEYLRDIADRHDLRRFIRFGTFIDEARWQDGCWHLHTADGQTHEADVLIAATGILSIPSKPNIPGMETFEGPMFHSAEWRHDVDLTDKRVAVVGTGASAIQIVPEIAPVVDKLHLFQRTPPWVLPRADRPFSAFEKRLMKSLPGYKHFARYLTYVMRELLAVGFVSLPAMHRALERSIRRYLEYAVPDPELRAQVTPTYTIGCKRVLLSNDYYPTLNRDNVALIPSALKEIRGNLVVAEDGTEREVDVIVWSTGFGVRDFMTKIKVVGNDGLELNEAWRDGIEAYYGMSVSGFPNFFLMLGPNTGLGHSSVVFMAEAQIDYIMQALETMSREGWRRFDVKTEAQRRFNDRIQTKMTEAVWMSGCRSWYLDARGKNDTLWPGYTFSYWLQTRRVDWRAYSTS